MKKLLAIVLTFVIGLVLLTGCGTKTTCEWCEEEEKKGMNDQNVYVFSFEN